MQFEPASLNQGRTWVCKVTESTTRLTLLHDRRWLLIKRMDDEVNMVMVVLAKSPETDRWRGISCLGAEPGVS
jgi:hypothetical protein